MASDIAVAGVAQSETDALPLAVWYLSHFRQYLPAIRASQLLTTYVSACYAELHEYGEEFVRVLQLIKDTSDQESISADVRRIGWRWYRCATDQDLNVRRDIINSDWVPMADDEVAELSALTERIRTQRQTEKVKRQQAREEATASDLLVDITTGRPGELTRTTKDFAKVLPCYLFHVRYPNDGGEDLWTAQSFLDGLGDRTGEEAIHWICYQLLPLGGRVKALLRQAEEVLRNPELLRNDVDERKKTRSIDLASVNALSSNTSARITAAADFRSFLAGQPKDV